MKTAFLVLTSITTFCGLARQSPADEGQVEVRAAIAKSLPYIVEKGEWWIEKKECVSCHRVSFMTWSLHSAKRHGFPVDGDKLAEWTEWSLSHQLGKNDKGRTVGAGNLEGLAQLLIGNTVSTESVRKEFLKLIQDGQQKEGHWKPGGQLPAQNRPQPETTAVSTIWIALALSDSNDETSSESRKKARDWIASAKPGETTEWHAASLLLNQRLERDDQVSTGVETLIARQNEDGGWGWNAKTPSDALATGQALYALRKAGVPRNDEAIQKAQTFLIKTQRENGSWSVPGTKRNKKGKPAETSTYWGTCWAAIGLMETLPD